MAYPEMDKVLQLCQMFNLNVDELLNKNISDVKESKEVKANINKFIDDFLNFITKTIDMFSSMKLKDKIKCLLEQIIISIIIAIVLLIIGALLIFLLDNVFYMIPIDFFKYIPDRIITPIYVVFAIILGIGILLHIFKVRYLDYYVIIRDESQEIENNENNNNDKNNDSKSNPNKKIYLEKKKEKIIIRDPNHSQYKFINGILRCVLFIIKALAFLVLIPFTITFILLIILFILAFLIMKSGLLFLGSLMIILAGILINLLLFYILYTFIFSRKLKINKIAIIFIISLMFIGIGTGLTIVSIKDFKYIDSTNPEYYLEEEFILKMEDNLIIMDNGNINYIEDNSSDIKVVSKHSKYYTLNYTRSDYNNTIIHIYLNIDDSNIIKNLNDMVDRLNNKEIVNFDNEEIYIYTSKDNINKLKENFNNYRYNRYIDRISELDRQLEEKEFKISELEDKINIYLNADD